MIKKSRFLIPFALFGLVLAGCTDVTALKDNFSEEDLAIDTPWSEFYLPATGVEFADGEDSISLNKGETHIYQYQIQPNGATGNSLNWFSNDENIATVEQGVLTAVGGGQTTIVASSPENAFDPVELSVTVNVPLVSFELDSKVTDRLDWSEQYQFEVNYEPADTTYRDLVYEIVNPSAENLVTVSNEGVISTSDQNGTAVLKVYSPFLGEENAKTYNLTISTIAVTSVVVSNADNLHEVEINHTLPLTATVSPNDATEFIRRGVKFYSRNENIAKVDELTGVVTGVSEGTAQIYAKCGIESDDYEVEVFAVHATSVSFVTNDFALSNENENGLTKQLEYSIVTDRANCDPSAAEISFVSSDETVATVTDSGLVTATGPGNAVITIKVAQEGLAVLEDTVNVAVTILSTKLTIGGGNSFYNDSTLTLTASLTPAKVSNPEITWSLEQDPAIVSLSATTGNSVTLTPVNNEVTGTVKVTATNTGGASSTLTVTVNERPSEFTAGQHYIVGNNLYNTGESVKVDGKSSWTTAKYAYHFTYKVEDPAVYEQFKGTIKFAENDEFRYFIGADYWVPNWEKEDSWPERGYHIEQDGAQNAFVTGDVSFVDPDDPNSNIIVNNAGWYDLYAKQYKNNDGSNWYALYIQKVPNLSVEIDALEMGLTDSYQIKAHDWIGTLTYEITEGTGLATVSDTGLVTANGAAGTVVITLTDGRGLTATVTITIKDGASISKTVYLNTNGMFDADGVVPFIHSWGDGEGNYTATKMEKVSGQTIIYSAALPIDHTGLIFVRCPEGSTELNWDLAYNKTENQTLPTDGKDMFTQTGWAEELDDHHHSYVLGSWSTFDSSVNYEPDGGHGGGEEHNPPYVMYGADPNWEFLPLVDNPENSNELMGSILLEADVEFVICVGEGDWRHYENKKDASDPQASVGSATGDEHNFRAAEKGTYTFYVLKDKYAEEGKTVYIGFTPAGGGGGDPTPSTFTVSFNANGAEGEMAAIPEQSGNYILPACTYTYEGKHFTGWKAGNTGDLIAAGAEYVLSADVTFYAQWEDDAVVVNAPYVQHSADGEHWTKVALVEDTSDDTQYKVQVTLVANEEFVVCVAEGEPGDWRHYEQFGADYSTGMIIKGSASGTNPDDPHNFKAKVAGTYNIYVKKAAAGQVFVTLEGETLVTVPYVMYSSNGEDWTRVGLVLNGAETQYEGSIDLAANDEFVINLGGGDWRHFENFVSSGSTNKIVQGTVDGQNFKASVAGTYNLFVKNDASHEVYITLEGESAPEPSTPHGPEGSTLVGWYIVGLEGDWTTANGIQLYSHPGSDDKCCILSVTFEVGDTFKITDGGSNWYGYHNNLGAGFEGIDDGNGGLNIRCTTAGTYNVYVNSSGQVYISAA